MRLALRLMCLFLLIGSAFAQGDRGTVTGTVADPTGAVVGGASIQAKNNATGAEYQTVSTATGNYTLSQLPAGVYQLTATMAGFKQFIRPGVEVQVAATFRVDITLEVGAPSESVTVSGEAPMLKTESGELSHNVSYDRVNDLPLITLGAGTGLGNIRNPLQVATLLPGASFASDNTLRVNGMPSSSQAIRIEGQDATNGLWRQLNQMNQSGLDAIQEVNIQTSNFAAEFGQAGGGYFNYTMKSGTNALHGSAYDYMVNEMLNAGTPNTNDGTGGHIRNKQRRNDYGFTLGGPIYIPHVYNGKDKSFFFFNFEQFREDITTSTGLTTVPTPAYLAGDFSAALGSQLINRTTVPAGVPLVDPLGRPVYQNEIYDPASTRIGPDNSVIRDPFMGCDGQHRNVICTTGPNAYALDPVALKVQAYLPAPNASGLINNYKIPAYDNFRHTTNLSFKIDHSLTSSIKMSGYFSEIITRSPNANGFETKPFSSVTPTDTHSYTSRLNYDQTVKPTMLLHAGVGLMLTNVPAIGQPFDQSTLGFKEKYFYDSFPQIGGLYNGVYGGNLVGLGAVSLYDHSRDIKPTANASLTWVKGNHTIKTGGEMVIEGLPVLNYTRANSNYAFAADQSALPYANPSILTLNSTTGFPYASFLLGRASALSVSQITDTRLGNHSLAFFAQDTWKITRKLTLDYGLRYDYATLLQEQYGRMQNADFNKPNSNAGNLPGAMIYEATCNCRFGQNYKYAFGPRIGLAYQIDQKTVFRAGGGIAYSTSPNNAFLSISVADFYQYAPPAFGVEAVVLKDGNPRPNQVWPDFTNNYPFQAPGGNVNPNAPFVSIADNTGRLPRIFQWSIGLQREVKKGLVVEAAYVGNRGAWWTAPLLAAQNYNGLTPEYLKSKWGLDITNPADGRLLNLQLGHPDVLARFPQFADPNVVYPGFPITQTLKQALRPHPQWLGVPPFLGPPLGDTWYDSLQAKVTKRFSHGLDFQGAFTWQKELALGANSDTSYVTPAPVVINDVFDRQSQKQISALSIPFMWVMSFSYTTPKIEESNTGMKVLSTALRDWRLSGVLRYQSGQVIRTPASQNGVMNQLARTDNPGNWGGGTTLMNRVSGQPLLTVDPNCHCFDPATTLVLNPGAWAEPGTGKFGTSAPYLNDYRWQRQPSENLSLGRMVRVREKASVEFRVELVNVFNRMFLPSPVPVSAGLFGASLTGTNTAAPVTKFANGNYSGGYGYVNTVNGAGSRPRSGQIVMRINF